MAGADREYAERNGMTLRHFQITMLNAQRELARGKKLADLTEQQRKAWRFAMYGEES